MGIRIPTKIILRIRHSGLLRVVLLALLLVAAAALGALYGAYQSIRSNLPAISEIETLRSRTITTVYSAAGEPIKEFAAAAERRVEIPYDRIPPVLIQAIVATEDPRFFSHGGVDVRGILRAVKEDVTKVLRGRKLEGGSTITQQLATKLFLHREQSLRRKLKEMFLSTQIEKRYSKEKILELYCNQFFLGNGASGVESASLLYFGKSAKDLTLDQAAVIAGLFRGPSAYSPYTKPEATLGRRNHVLSRMQEEGYITAAAASEAKKQPLGVLPRRKAGAGFGAYFFEEIRRYIEKTYGEDALGMGGLKVYTTIDPTLQAYAEQSLRNGLREWEHVHKGWRKERRNVIAEGTADPAAASLDSWTSGPLEPGEVYDAVVLSADKAQASLRVKDFACVVPAKEVPAWTRAKTPDALMKRGDVVQVRITALDEAARTAKVTLDQEPEVQGAFLAVEPATGQIRAMVGGYSFDVSQFNRAVQAPRQTGSAIKPFIYTAAIDGGNFNPASVLMDEPTTYIDPWTKEPWSPKNYDRKYKGAITLRQALEGSRNVPTAQLLSFISPQTGVEYCRKFGLSATMYPYLSLSLGTFDVPLIEMVSAYSVFPNKGVRARPYFITRIEDKEGNVMEENRTETEDVISPQTAYVMTSILQGVVQRGTAATAARLDWPLGGKTGTTDKHTDAWFIGFSPTLCAGVWVGYDQPTDKLGNLQSGAVVALPIWVDFFSRVIADKKKAMKEQEAAGGQAPVEDFTVPGNLVFLDIDRRTGLLLTPICKYPFREVFFPGNVPSRFCSNEEHLRILDYYGEENAEEEH